MNHIASEDFCLTGAI